MANMKITLKKSLVGRLEKHIATAHSLGLKKINDVTLADNTISKKISVLHFCRMPVPYCYYIITHTSYKSLIPSQFP